MVACHHEMLDLHGVERILQVADRQSKVIAGIGGIEARSGVIDDGPAGTRPPSPPPFEQQTRGKPFRQQRINGYLG